MRGTGAPGELLDRGAECARSLCQGNSPDWAQGLQGLSRVWETRVQLSAGRWTLGGIRHRGDVSPVS